MARRFTEPDIPGDNRFVYFIAEVLFHFFDDLYALNSVRLVQKHLNTDLMIDGVLLTMLDARTNLGIQVIEEVKKYFRDKVYKSSIVSNTPSIIRSVFKCFCTSRTELSSWLSPSSA